MNSEDFVTEWIRRLVDAAPALPQEAREVVRRLMRPAPGELDLSGPERAA